MSPSLRSPDRPAKIREVQPIQEWRTDCGGAASSVTGWEDAATIREEQRRLGADERAEVLVLDLARFRKRAGSRLRSAGPSDIGPIRARGTHRFAWWSWAGRSGPPTGDG